MKKVIAILLAIMMVAGMLAGCSNEAGGDNTQPGSQNSATGGGDTPGGDTGIKLDGSWPAEKIKIGVEAFDTTDESFLAVMEYFEYLGKYFNVDIVISETLNAAEDEFAFINNCAAAGCKGIFGYYNIAGDEAIKLATSLGMYYWGTEGSYNNMAEDPNYVGTYTFSDVNDASAKNGEYLAGYEIGYTMANSGLEHLVFCNGGAAIGVPMFIDRQAGVLDGIAAAQAEGSATRFDPATDIIEGFPNDAWFAAQAAALAGDYDGLVITFDAFTWFQPIMESGKDFKVGCIGTVNDTYKTFVENGTVIALVYDCGEVVFGSVFANIVNAATGHLELTRGADGKALLNPTQRWVLTNPDDFNAVYEKHSRGEYFITPEDMASILGGANPDATVNDVIALFDLSLADALKK